MQQIFFLDEPVLKSYFLETKLQRRLTALPKIGFGTAWQVAATAQDVGAARNALHAYTSEQGLLSSGIKFRALTVFGVFSHYGPAIELDLTLGRLRPDRRGRVDAFTVRAANRALGSVLWHDPVLACVVGGTWIVMNMQAALPRHRGHVKVAFWET